MLCLATQFHSCYCPIIQAENTILLGISVHCCTALQVNCLILHKSSVKEFYNRTVALRDKDQSVQILWTARASCSGWNTLTNGRVSSILNLTFIPDAWKNRNKHTEECLQCICEL